MQITEKVTYTKQEVDEWLAFKQGFKKREQVKKEQLQKKYQMYLLFAQAIAERLYQEFKVEKVYLIGSLLDFDWFHRQSDIDIAVEGLDSKEYFKAFLMIEKLTNGESFHLIDMKDIASEFKTKIITTGKLL